MFKFIQKKLAEEIRSAGDKEEKELAGFLTLRRKTEVEINPDSPPFRQLVAGFCTVYAEMKPNPPGYVTFSGYGLNYDSRNQHSHYLGWLVKKAPEQKRVRIERFHRGQLVLIERTLHDIADL